MASDWRAGGDREVLLLLEEYCSHRRPTATRPRPGVIRPQGPRPGVLWSDGPDPDVIQHQGPGPGVVQFQGPGPSVMRPQGGSFSSCSSSSSSSSSSRSFLSTTVPAIVKFRTVKVRIPSTPELESDSVGGKYDDSDSESQSRSSAVERLVQITEAAPVPQVYVESQDEIVQKLVNLMITLGDDINQKIAQTPLLQQQLSNMNYELFEKVTSTVQSLVDSNPGRAAGSRTGTGFESEAEVQQQKIAWAFEVTSRLSVVGVVQRRRVLSFGDKYIQQHHSAWVQQHGGWDEVFAVD